MSGQPRHRRQTADLPALQGRRHPGQALAGPDLRRRPLRNPRTHYIQSTPPQGAHAPRVRTSAATSTSCAASKAARGHAPGEYAWRRLTEANPLPAVMGRVCPGAPANRAATATRSRASSASTRSSITWANGPSKRPGVPQPAESTGKTVAVIGGGPAGLSAAYQLARKGHAVTLFEERPRAGRDDALRHPRAAAPRKVLDAEIQRIPRPGVTTRKLPHRHRHHARADPRRLRRGVPGPGRAERRPLPMADSEAPNVVTATAFLKAFNDGRMQHVGKRVVVVGGGDTSIDVATVARAWSPHRFDARTDRPSWRSPAARASPRLDIGAGVRAGRQNDLDLGVRDRQDARPAGTVEHALGRHRHPRRLAPVGVVRDAAAPSHALRVIRRCGRDRRQQARDQNLAAPRDIEADLIVSAIGHGRLHRLEALNNGRARWRPDKNYQVQGRPGANRRVLRRRRDPPHLLTTAVGHGAIAADGIDRHLRGGPRTSAPRSTCTAST